MPELAGASAWSISWSLPPAAGEVLAAAAEHGKTSLPARPTDVSVNHYIR